MVIDMERARDTGYRCFECEQLVKVYKRSVTSIMAAALISLYRRRINSDERYFHVSEIDTSLVFGGGDFAKFEYWGLILPKKNEDPRKRTSGVWAITERGVGFVKRKLMIPKYALVYNQECLGFDGYNVSIVECLKNKFDYGELMKT